LHRIHGQAELDNLRKNAKISVLDYCLAMNASTNHSFVDLDRYPVLPNLAADDPPDRNLPTASTVTNALSIINPFHSFDRALGEFPNFRRDSAAHLPADFYFQQFSLQNSLSHLELRRALEDPANFPTVSNWVREVFGARLPPSAVSLSIDQRDADLECLPVPFSLSPGFSMRFEFDGIVSEAGLVCPIPSLPSAFVRYCPEDWRLEVVSRKASIVSHSNPIFAFATSIAVGELGLYFVVDLETGVSIGYRIEYRDRRVVSFYSVSRCETDAPPKSAVSDTDGIVATASGLFLTLWQLESGIVHRRIRLESKITAVAFDASFHSIMAATEDQFVYLDVNGDVLLSLGLGGRVVCSMAFVSQAESCAFAGTREGKLVVLRPMFREKRIDAKEMESGHKAAIVGLLVHPSKKLVLSVDADGCVWQTRLRLGR
jgi:hypothetical protein